MPEEFGELSDVIYVCFSAGAKDMFRGSWVQKKKMALSIVNEEKYKCEI